MFVPPGRSSPLCADLSVVSAVMGARRGSVLARRPA